MQISKEVSAPQARRGERLETALSPALFKALGDPGRVALVARLAACGRPCTVTELAACCPTDLSVVSRHLAMLRDAGVLSAEKRGRRVYYSVRFDVLKNALEEMSAALSDCCGATTAEPVPRGVEP